jgi:nucleoside-diphosphate-sugar epimerase
LIVGNGMLARAFAAFEHDPGITIFASGVSNSGETDSAEFGRERRCLEAVSDRGLLVYFSTCSLYDRDLFERPYIHHKRTMEALVRSRRHHLILRLPQIVGRSDNPHTLTNYLRDRMVQGEEFSIWERACRNLMDVDDVAAATWALVEGGAIDETIDVASPHNVRIPELVGIMETVLGVNARVRSVDRGGGCVEIDTTRLAGAWPGFGALADPGYLPRVLFKYYAGPNQGADLCCRK